MLNIESATDIKAIGRELMTIEYTLFKENSFSSQKARALLLQAKMLLDNAAEAIYQEES